MSRPWKIGIAIGAGLLVIGAGIFTLRQTREPVFEGKPLSHWLDDVRAETQASAQSPQPANPDPMARAEDAVAAIGPEAVPSVAAWASGDPYRLGGLYRRLYHETPTTLRGRLPLPAQVVPFRPDQSIRLFNAATAQADATAIPGLCSAYASGNVGVRRAAILCLRRLAPQDPQAVLPVLQQALQDSDITVRLSAGTYVCRMARTDPEARRILTEHLDAVGTNAPEWMRQAAREAGQDGNGARSNVAAPNPLP